MISLIQSIDMRVLESLYAMRDLPTTKVFIAISETGSIFSVVGLLACLCLFLAMRKQYRWIAGLLLSTGGAAATMLALKHIIARARPDVFFRAYYETGFSFPSGHATLAAAFYGFCIYLAWRTIPNPQWRRMITACLGILIIAIAFSRIYLGVHYASDILGGLVLGAFFVWLGIFVVRRLEKNN